MDAHENFAAQETHSNSYTNYTLKPACSKMLFSDSFNTYWTDQNSNSSSSSSAKEMKVASSTGPSAFLFGEDDCTYKARPENFEEGNNTSFTNFFPTFSPFATPNNTEGSSGSDKVYPNGNFKYSPLSKAVSKEQEIQNSTEESLKASNLEFLGSLFKKMELVDLQQEEKPEKEQNIKTILDIEFYKNISEPLETDMTRSKHMKSSDCPLDSFYLGKEGSKKEDFVYYLTYYPTIKKEEIRQEVQSIACDSPWFSEAKSKQETVITLPAPISEFPLPSEIAFKVPAQDYNTVEFLSSSYTGYGEKSSELYFNSPPDRFPSFIPFDNEPEAKAEKNVEKKAEESIVRFSTENPTLFQSVSPMQPIFNCILMTSRSLKDKFQDFVAASDMDNRAVYFGTSASLAMQDFKEMMAHEFAIRDVPDFDEVKANLKNFQGKVESFDLKGKVDSLGLDKKFEDLKLQEKFDKLEKDVKSSLDSVNVKGKLEAVKDMLIALEQDAKASISSLDLKGKIESLDKQVKGMLDSIDMEGISEDLLHQLESFQSVDTKAVFESAADSLKGILNNISLMASQFKNEFTFEPLADATTLHRMETIALKTKEVLADLFEIEKPGEEQSVVPAAQIASVPLRRVIPKKADVTLHDLFKKEISEHNKEAKLEGNLTMKFTRLQVLDEIRKGERSSKKFVQTKFSPPASSASIVSPDFKTKQLLVEECLRRQTSSLSPKKLDSNTHSESSVDLECHADLEFEVLNWSEFY